jgi:cell division protein FtsQ
MTGTRRSTLVINKRRKGLLAVIMPWMKRFGVVLVIAGLSFWAGSWFWLSGNMERTKNWIGNKTVEAGAGMGFSVNNILVEGRVYIDPAILKAVINVEKGDPLLAFNPAEMREQLKQLNWIRDVHVERRMPDTLYIGLVEKKPLALWQTKGALELLDEEGKPITRENLGRFRNLVIVMGDEAPAQAPELIRNLKAEPKILSNLKAAKWMGERRWDLVFKNDVTAKLPEEEIGLALRRLASAIQDNNILEKNIVSVDLREEGRMIVQTAPGAAQEYKASAKSGNNI